MTATGEWRGAEYSEKLTLAVVEGLNNGAEYLRTVSVPRTPVDTSLLRSTAAVVPATPSELMSAVTFDTPYAVAQHENLDYSHEEGEAKYLERPLVENGQKITQIIAAPIGRIR